MKEILKSLFAILFVTALVASSTTAYFGDSEKSDGNIFVAGQIDLRIDSESHYNGMVCQNDAWVNPEDIVEPEENIIVERVQDSQPGIGDIDTECQDFGFDFGVVKWVRDAGFWEPEEGEELGTILSGDENDIDWDIATSTAEGIIVKAGNTVYYGIIGESGQVSQSQPGLSHITFCGFEAPPVCQGTWEEADLQDGEHVLFNFSDVKVGDAGENTLSLRIYDNDAWARMTIDVVADEDNGCVEPEIDDDPDCDEAFDPGGAGELRENLEFTLWLDQGSVPGFQNTHLTEDDDGYDHEEGDNIHQESSEPFVFEQHSLDEENNEWSFGDVIALSYDSFCIAPEFFENGHNEHGECHGIAVDGRMVGGTVYYLGLAWELPEGTSNAVQSDVFIGDISFEVEQQRNNDIPFTN